MDLLLNPQIVLFSNPSHL